MSGIYKEGYFFGDNGNGHNIKSNGTDQYPRESLNFSGFDLADDPTNDETDVKAHRLSSAELDEILSDPIPPKPTELPVLFDETGAERIVGWYKYADGTKKPVYKKTLSGTVNSPELVDTNIDAIVTIDVAITLSNGNIAIAPDVAVGQIFVNMQNGNLIVSSTNEYYVNRPYKVIIQYTKSTDTPV